MRRNEGGASAASKSTCDSFSSSPLSPVYRKEAHGRTLHSAALLLRGITGRESGARGGEEWTQASLGGRVLRSFAHHFHPVDDSPLSPSLPPSHSRCRRPHARQR